MTVRMLLRHSSLILIVIMVLSGAHAMKKRQRSREVDRCKSDLSRCASNGGIACMGTGYIIRCYYGNDRCDGKMDCPLGEDEMYCRTPIRPTPTRFVISTISTTTTTTTTQISSSAAPTMTFANTVTVTSNAFVSTTISPTFSVAATTISTTSTLVAPFTTLFTGMAVALGGMVGPQGFTCVLMAAPAMFIAVADDFFFSETIITSAFTLTLTPSCLPSSVVIRV